MRVLALASCFAAAMAAPVETVTSAFAEFKTTYSKTYENAAEEAYKLSVFADTMTFIAKHNAEEARGMHTHTVGVTQFADLTNAEFKALMTTPYKRNSPQDTVTLPLIVSLNSTATAVDWRTKGAVTPVKNQGTCGSCWSFSTTGSTEGAWKIAGNDLVPLSEQQLMDCSTAEGNKGCQGGLMDDAFKYIIKNGGLDTEADYAYTMKNGKCDKAKEANHVAAVASFKDVPQNNEAQLLAAVTQQPVSIAIEADKPAFQHYKTGVLTDTACGDKLDHGVLVVGYGTDAGTDYWIVKNSWGATWGEEGYIRLGRGLNAPKGLCGINMQPSWPTAGKPGPAPPPGPPTPPAGNCPASAPATRTKCGPAICIGCKTECEAAGCCYDSSVLDKHCYHPSGPAPPPPPGPSPGGNPWADPNDGPCPSGSEAVQITGVTGNFCSPTCSASKPCPPVPTGVTAQGECALSTAGAGSPTQCALICTPALDGLVGAAGGCPAKATCKAIQTTGICTFDSR